jgi:hypothetical protein
MVGYPLHGQAQSSRDLYILQGSHLLSVRHMLVNLVLLPRPVWFHCNSYLPKVSQTLADLPCQVAPYAIQALVLTMESGHHHHGHQALQFHLYTICSLLVEMGGQHHPLSGLSPIMACILETSAGDTMKVCCILI